MISGLIGRIALRQQLPEHFRHHHHVVEDHQVSHGMIVFDDLALFIASISHNDAFAAKEHPAQKAVKRYWGATEQLWNVFHNCSYRSPHIMEGSDSGDGSNDPDW